MTTLIGGVISVWKDGKIGDHSMSMAGRKWKNKGDGCLPEEEDSRVSQSTTLTLTTLQPIGTLLWGGVELPVCIVIASDFVALIAITFKKLFAMP